MGFVFLENEFEIMLYNLAKKSKWKTFQSYRSKFFVYCRTDSRTKIIKFVQNSLATILFYYFMNSNLQNKVKTTISQAVARIWMIAFNRILACDLFPEAKFGFSWNRTISKDMLNKMCGSLALALYVLYYTQNCLSFWLKFLISIRWCHFMRLFVQRIELLIYAETKNPK